jgi:two-component system, NarL family, response regulator
MTGLEKGQRIRVLLADDHPVVREGVAALINRRSDMTVVAQASGGREVLGLFRQHHPDVALIDLRMPEMDGLEVISALRRDFPAACIVVLTTFDDNEDIYRALRAGARGYLLKDVPREELLHCIRLVHEGKTYFGTGVATKLAERVRWSELTARELEVLQLMAEGKSNKEVAAALFVAEATIKVHVVNILHKLGVGGRTEAVTLAIRRGIVRIV